MKTALSVFGLVVGLLFGTPPSIARAAGADQPEVFTKKTYSGLKTAAEFSRLSDAAKTALFEFGGIEPNNVDVADDVPLANINGGIRRQINTAIKIVSAEMDTDVSNETDPTGSGIVAIGEPKYHFRLVTLKATGELLGVAIDVRQEGGAVRDERGDGDEDRYQHHYASKEEAKAAGVDVEADVSWSGVAIFDFSSGRLKKLSVDPGLTWTGW